MFASQSLLRIYVCSRFVYGFYGWHVQIALFDLLRLERICPAKTKERRTQPEIRDMWEKFVETCGRN
jgi:hypothetical protein